MIIIGCVLLLIVFIDTTVNGYNHFVRIALAIAISFGLVFFGFVGLVRTIKYDFNHEEIDDNAEH